MPWWLPDPEWSSRPTSLRLVDRGPGMNPASLDFSAQPAPGRELIERTALVLPSSMILPTMTFWAICRSSPAWPNTPFRRRGQSDFRKPRLRQGVVPFLAWRYDARLAVEHFCPRRAPTESCKGFSGPHPDAYQNRYRAHGRDRRHVYTSPFHLSLKFSQGVYIPYS
jgi:hypothetical protein